jgi:hypothetical protein
VYGVAALLAAEVATVSAPAILASEVLARGPSLQLHPRKMFVADQLLIRAAGIVFSKNRFNPAPDELIMQRIG